jgi:thiol-disulfide isomerase/thioredoxin
METMKDALNKATKILSDKTNMMYGAIALGLLSILFIVVGYMYKNKIIDTFKVMDIDISKGMGIDKSKDDSSSDEPIELMLFSVDWCPHCKSAKPEWDKLVSGKQGKKINGRKVIFTDINCTEETPQVEALIKQYNIEGYPTIIMLKDGQVIPYGSKPTESLISSFLDSKA